MVNSSFQKLKFKVYDVPQGTDLLGQFPELACKAFKDYKKSNRNYVIRYIIYCYDFNSDLIEQFSDLNKRKEAALDLAGFDRNLNTGKFSEEVYEMINLQIPEINDMIFAFLGIVKNRTWDLIVIHEENFAEYKRLLLDPIYSSQAETSKESKTILEAATVKSKLREELKSIAKDLEGFYKDLYGDNIDVRENQEKPRPISPETILKHLKKAG